MRGAVTTGSADAEDDAHVLPKDVDFTLHLAEGDWSKSYSLKNFDKREITATSIERPYWLVGDVINEVFTWNSDFPPLVEGETVTVRLTYVPPPPAPTNLTASPGDRRVTLAWDAPAADAGHHAPRIPLQVEDDGRLHPVAGDSRQCAGRR